jgi:LysM repeat protein
VPVRGRLWGSHLAALLLGVIIIAWMSYSGMRFLLENTAAPTKVAASAPAVKTPFVYQTPTPTLTPLPTFTFTPTPTPTAVYHKIGKDETLLVIAGIYGVTVDDILKANPGTNAKALRVGQELLIPITNSTVETAPQPTSATVEYEIKGGDTLGSIALQFGTDIDTIMKLNPSVDIDIIHPGDKLIVPLVPPTATPTATMTITPTPTAPPPYSAPLLLYPPDKAELDNEILLFNWTSVALLKDNEAYIFELQQPDGEVKILNSKMPSLRLSKKDIKMQGQFLWRVFVAIVDEQGNIKQVVSVQQPARSFEWK